MTWVLGAASLVLGCLLGSFGNVLIHRIPRGESIVSPPSACPSCGAPIRRRHNVPVLGWLWLRGRCRDCQVRISVRYPVIEAATGAAFVAIVIAYGPRAETVLLWISAFFGLVLTAIDIELRRLPTVLVRAFGISVLVAMVGISVSAGEWGSWIRVTAGAAALGALYLGAALAYPKGMGMGDVRLAPVLGGLLGWFGWPELVVGGFAAFVWGALAGVLAMAQQGRARGVTLPFGPWMFVGAATGIVTGVAVSAWYLDVVGLSGA